MSKTSLYHLAQLNVANAKADMESAVMQGFVARLEEINALADQAPGFVWRLQDESGDATSIDVFGDPLLLVNMSVWESLEDLKNYVYQTLHVEVLRNRNAWFNAMKEANLALWWIKAGHIPDTAEAKQKLEHIRTHGPTPEAFTFGKPFPAPPQGSLMADPNAPYHAHIYYDMNSRHLAVAIRDQLLSLQATEEKPHIEFVGELRDHKVGPHSIPQFEIHFRCAELPAVVPLLEASGLAVLVHPLTLDDLADHTTLGTWIGRPVPLDLSVLDPPGFNQGFDRFGKTDF